MQVGFGFVFGLILAQKTPFFEGFACANLSDQFV